MGAMDWISALLGSAAVFFAGFAAVRLFAYYGIYGFSESGEAPGTGQGEIPPENADAAVPDSDPGSGAEPEGASETGAEAEPDIPPEAEKRSAKKTVVMPKRPSRTVSYRSWKVLSVLGVSAGVYLAATLLHSGTGIMTQIGNAVLLVFMTLLTFTDWLHTRIPNRILSVMGILWMVLASVSVIASPAAGIAMVGSGLGGALISGVSFLLCYLLSRGKLGGGDVKLSFLLGLYLGGGRIMGALITGMLICFVYSLLGLLRRKLSVSDGVPLVPFLYIGVLITLLNPG